MVVRVVEISARGYKTFKKMAIKIVSSFCFDCSSHFFYNFLISTMSLFFFGLPQFYAGYYTLFQKIQIIKISIAKREDFLRSSFCKIS